jgi:hypothetical protein
MFVAGEVRSPAHGQGHAQIRDEVGSVFPSGSSQKTTRAASTDWDAAERATRSKDAEVTL